MPTMEVQKIPFHNILLLMTKYHIYSNIVNNLAIMVPYNKETQPMI